MGLVETLWQGFAIVIRRPGLVAIPILVDLVAWLGPKITATSFADAAQQLLLRWLILAQSDPSANVSPDQIDQVRETMTRQISALANVNLLSVVGWQLPGLVGLEGDWSQTTFSPDRSTLVAVLFGLLAAGLVVAAGYYLGIAQAVRGEPLSVGQLLRRLPRMTFRLVLWLMLIAVAFLAIGGPLLIVIGIIGLISQAAAAVVVLVVPVLLLLLAWLFAFAPSAIFLADTGPIRAMVASARVVLRQPGGTLRFLTTVWILSLGWSIVWTAASQHPIGGAIAIVGQGVLSTSLAASTMIYLFARVKVPALARTEDLK